MNNDATYSLSIKAPENLFLSRVNWKLVDSINRAWNIKSKLHLKSLFEHHLFAWCYTQWRQSSHSYETFRLVEKTFRNRNASISWTNQIRSQPRWINFITIKIMQHEIAFFFINFLTFLPELPFTCKAIIIKFVSLHHQTPLNILETRTASGLMEIWKARNSINLLLIDLISFLRPPIDAPKKKTLLLLGCRWVTRPTINSKLLIGMSRAVRFCFRFNENS